MAVGGELTDPENKEPLKSLVSAPKFNARKGFLEVPRCRNTEQSKYQANVAVYVLAGIIVSVWRYELRNGIVAVNPAVTRLTILGILSNRRSFTLAKSQCIINKDGLSSKSLEKNVQNQRDAKRKR